MLDFLNILKDLKINTKKQPKKKNIYTYIT